MTFIHKAGKLLSAVSLVAMAAPVVAQDQDDAGFALEEIVVTAQMREQGLQDVPVSINAVAGDVIVKQGVNRLEDLTALVPNFQMTETGISTTIAIRGIFSGQNQAFEQSVATYIDGIHHGRGQQARAPFLDLARVEVLRGPQGILVGKNAVAGALNIVTAAPTDEVERFMNLEYIPGEQDVTGTFVINAPLSDTFRARAAIRYKESDGYIENTTLDRDEPQRENLTGRLTLQWDASDDLTFTLKAETSRFDVDGRHIEIQKELTSLHPSFLGATYGQILTALTGDTRLLDTEIDGRRTGNGDTSRNNSETLVLTTNYEMDGGNLTLITGYSGFDYQDVCDCDFTGATVFRADLQEEWEQFSQEIRYVSDISDDYDFIIGGFFQTSKHDYADQIVVPGNSVLVPVINGVNGLGSFIADAQANRIANVDADVYSAFGQVTWHAQEDLHLTLGGRLNHEKKSGDRVLWASGQNFEPLTGLQAVVAPQLFAGLFDIFEHEVDGEISETNFSPLVNVQWDASEDAMLYATWTRGYKSGGFDFRANNPGQSSSFAESFAFLPEKVSSFEVGGKTSFLDGRGELNFALFRMKYSDLQVSIFDGTLGFNVTNAAGSKSQGIEVDGRLALTENLTARYAASLIDFKYTDFQQGQCNQRQTPDSIVNGFEFCDYTGERAQTQANFQSYIALDYGQELTDEMMMNLTLSANYTSGYNASPTLDEGLYQSGYGQLDARLAIGDVDGAWEVAVLAKNLTDKQPFTYGGWTPLAGTSFLAPSRYTFIGRGRTIGGQVSFRF